MVTSLRGLVHLEKNEVEPCSTPSLIDRIGGIQKLYFRDSSTILA